MIRQSIAAAAFCLLFATTAHATANIGCSVDDAQLKLSVDALEGLPSTGPLIDLKASATIASAEVPPEYRKIALDKALVERWLLGPDFRMHFYHEAEDARYFVSYDLVIMAVEEPDSDGLTFKGPYTLTFAAHSNVGGAAPVDTTITGTATCYAG